jgi:hypothetical protein
VSSEYHSSGSGSEATVTLKKGPLALVVDACNSTVEGPVTDLITSTRQVAAKEAAEDS